MTSATTRCSPETSITAFRSQLAGDPGADARAFTIGYTNAVDGWLARLLGDVGDGVALVAVGSYGRAELCPGSDLDVVLVHRRRRDVARIADRVWYPIWDAGLRLDHSVRTVGEALDVARDDLKVLLGLLDARLVAGDALLADDVRRGALDLWRRHAPRWLERLERECLARHSRAGELPYLLEPDLKESRGGQRDVTVLRALHELGIPGRERPDVQRAASALLSVRVALQHHLGRAEERLHLEDQDPVAAALGEPDADALMAHVASAGRTVSWAFDQAWRAVNTRPRRRVPSSMDVAPGIAARGDEIVLTEFARPLDDDSLLLRVAAASAYFGLPPADATVEHLRQAAPRMTGAWSGEAREAFVALLGAGNTAIDVVESLDQLGLWTRVIPEWAAVRSLPQRNAFHRYTVDRHLLETAARATRAIRHIERPDLLLVGALVHDIGKGFPGDHTVAGIDVADMLAARMGFPPDDVATVVDLVRHHLLLPAVATSRDLDDDNVIAAVAETIGSIQRLELLHALVEADSLATGDTAWTPWKAELVDELVKRVRARIGGAKPATVRLDAPERALLARFDGSLAVEVDGRHVSVVAPDRRALFATVVGVLSLHGHSVHAARARTTERGVAVSAFDVGAGESAPDAAAIERDVQRVLAGELHLEARLADKATRAQMLRRPRAAHPAQPLVVFDHAGSARATIVEVRAPDGIGVLFRTTNALASLDLDIRHAKVSTLGHEVIDTFYVVGPDRKKITDDAALARIESAVLDVLDDGGLRAPGTQ